jgi:hypothetical protein
MLRGGRNDDTCPDCFGSFPSTEPGSWVGQTTVGRGHSPKGVEQQHTQAVESCLPPPVLVKGKPKMCTSFPSEWRSCTFPRLALPWFTTAGLNGPRDMVSGRLAEKQSTPKLYSRLTLAFIYDALRSNLHLITASFLRGCGRNEYRGRPHQGQRTCLPTPGEVLILENRQVECKACRLQTVFR